MALLMSGATEATASQMFGFPGLARVALISSLPLKPVKLTTDRMAAGLLARPRPRHTTHVLVVSFYLFYLYPGDVARTSAVYTASVHL